MYTNNNNQAETSVYRKVTNTSIFMNWHFHAPSDWRIGTLRNLIKSENLISFLEFVLRNKINNMRNIFTEYNDYPIKIVSDKTDQELSQLWSPILEGSNFNNQLKRHYQKILKH